MRSIIAALAASILVACAAEKTPPREPLTLVRTERTMEVADSTKPVHAAPGKVFVTVHLKEDPAPRGSRDWLESVMEDWDGQKYPASFAGVVHSGSGTGTSDFRGRTINKALPDEIHVVFEVPQTATLRTVTVPQPISLFDIPAETPHVAARLIHRVEPHYPDDVRGPQFDGGLVKFEVLVMPDGTVGGVDHVHGDARLGAAGAAAIRQWRYEPARNDSKAVPSLIRVEMRLTPSSS
jgi:outer membrane biosynthesis protein TonB